MLKEASFWIFGHKAIKEVCSHLCREESDDMTKAIQKQRLCLQRGRSNKSHSIPRYTSFCTESREIVLFTTVRTVLLYSESALPTLFFR